VFYPLILSRLDIGESRWGTLFVDNFCGEENERNT
jgi:hypothetical protein